MTRRLLLTYLTFGLLILAALEIPLGWMQQRNEQQHALEQLEHDAEVLAVFVDAAFSDGGQVNLLAAETAQRLGGEVDVVDGAGRTLTSTRATGPLPDGAADIGAVLHGQGRVRARITGSDSGEVIVVTVPVHPGVIAQGAIRVSVPAASLTTRIHRFWLLLAAAGVIVLAAAALTAVALARWISRPVRALERATGQAAQGTAPGFLPTSTGPPELRRLATTFAATAHRLHTLIATQRAFIGHASHQLKTPLAALRLRLENLEHDAAESQGRDLRAALAETDRLTRLVDTLLKMARYEQVELRPEPAGVADVVAMRVQHWQPVAAAGAVELKVTGDPDARVQSLPGSVEQILDNLLSNAVRAAPPGSTVTVSWQPGPDGWELHVTDQGAGLTAEECVRAMDPFWRAPNAPKGGTGLGLALVRQLAEAAGGRAELRSMAGPGTDAVVCLPAALST
ncbi:signal transduction histidine kinase [Actinoplanes tereljensis]|uniref:histidine kinase n=1 Tax=Paractinoplanes tereljensis TaxID=571912 RepID=A0A919NHP7_9ACTN|nr:HAMP domain-containing sensor histidine kinase [Actinoplanes tereljensis]GIF18315.1 two-component sensor histidine kinase [Actinoplanes tereljensis]